MKGRVKGITQQLDIPVCYTLIVNSGNMGVDAEVKREQMNELMQSFM
jgi:hypothetical protein